MTIKEVENQTGLTRSNIRFYEKEKLIAPSRNERNGYRDYSRKDVEIIKKIAYLRTLGISVEDIRSVISGKITLHEVIEKQNEQLRGQIADMYRAKAICEKMLKSKQESFDELQIENYVTEVHDYWKEYPFVFKLDSVSFVHLWGSLVSWSVIAGLCLIIGVLAYAKLPPEIPVQWSGGAASSMADKKFIFAYPAACVVIRVVLRPFIYARLNMSHFYGELITEYLTNYLCFVALSAEIFSILFMYGVVKNIVFVLVMDTVVFIGLLAAGIIKMDLRRSGYSGK